MKFYQFLQAPTPNSNRIDQLQIDLIENELAKYWLAEIRTTKVRIFSKKEKAMFCTFPVV